MADMTQATPHHSRAAKIAAIHELANWLAAHPEAPVPTDVTATHYAMPSDEADESIRVAGVLTAMRQLEMRPSEGDTTVQGSLVLLSLGQHGIRVAYELVAIKNKPTRYVARERV